MLKFKEKNKSILILLIFNNLLSLLLILKSIYKKKSVAFYLAIFFSIIAYYYTAFNEYSDVYRYINYPEAVLRNSKDIYVKYILGYLIKNKYSINFLIMISAFLMYYYFFKSFEIAINKMEYSGKKYLYYYFLFYCILPSFGYTGIRFYPATAIFTYSIVLKIFYRDKRYYFFAFLATLVHIFYFLPFILLVLENIIKKILKYEIVEKFISILVVLSFFGVGEWLIKIIFIYINNLNINISDAYFYGKWGTEYYKYLNIGGKLVYIANRLFYTWWLYFYFKLKLNKNLKIEQQILLYLSVICLLTASFRTIHERIFMAIYYPTILILLTTRKIKPKLIKNILILMSFCYTVLQFILLVKSYSPEIIYLLKNIWRFSIISIMI